MKRRAAHTAAPVPTTATRLRTSGRASRGAPDSSRRSSFAAMVRSSKPHPPYAAVAMKPAASHDRLGYCHHTRPALTTPPIVVVQRPAADRDRAWSASVVNTFSPLRSAMGDGAQSSVDPAGSSESCRVVIARSGAGSIVVTRNANGRTGHVGRHGHAPPCHAGAHRGDDHDDG